ncbi:Uncharacterised protein [Klebsiella variicola]|nr:Uncharacterised protein [Klebsiella variicola]
MLINVPGYVLHCQGMDCLTFFVDKKFFRLQTVRPELRLFSLIYFGTGEREGNLLTFTLHIKLSIQSRKKTNWNAPPH